MDIRVHSRTRAHPARDPTGESVMPSPRLTGTRDQEQKEQEPSAGCLALALSSARTMRAAPAFPGPHYIAAAADEKAR
ncbi:hypothetical protein D1Z90_20775 [Motilimonas pumila]|uniref:Uncharacterized protein n=1 Tax=Motilimonas pumila TaxID=2303987 RepID=A0A418Y8Y9_9GAMM|nr:hypothetical protein D1Z90_20775 [Motilimonas pumila]